MQDWIKKGLLHTPPMDAFEFGSHPCIIHIEGNRFIIAFTCRDVDQRSHIFLATAEVTNGHISLTSRPNLALSPGLPGYFDCDGVISGCLIRHRGTIYLYFVGWQNLPGGLWVCDTGRATVDAENLIISREFEGPVIGRDRYHPLFAAATAFHIADDGAWHTWYNSGIRWERSEEGWKHFYGIHHAQSTDGLNWKFDQEMCIPFRDEYEYAFGRPSVVYWGHKYRMWFAARATKHIDTYRMCYASSVDGINWERDDRKAGIDVADSGWDSEMICYPCVFEHEDIRYMLYNGNGYGKTGFGYAVMEGFK